MSLSAVYDDTLSRVQLTATSLGASATHALLERSHNETWWDTVRGGTSLPVTDGDAQLDEGDAEFFPGVPTHYRITSFDDSEVQQAQFTTDITVNLTQMWLVSLRFPMLNIPVTPANHGDVVLANPSVAVPIEGRSLPVGLEGKLGGRDHSIDLTTTTRLEEDRLLLRLRVGTHWYIQVPGSGPLSELLPGSMHVLIGDPVKHRLGEVTAYNLFRLPLTEIAAYDALIVPTNLTAGTVINTYGSVSAVWAAHPTVRSLWETIGDPSDLITL